MDILDKACIQRLEDLIIAITEGRARVSHYELLVSPNVKDSSSRKLVVDYIERFEDKENE